ncbi:retrotransposon protein, putative, unclassified [Panicum miliaceum]|uniref:Retrotransposon protein, putative, unclassified n=1 Tax=Panicum miliaceum TaxID=4540 RepID=A0A3L6T4U7_PANMI|nr:retrotransposon protein, putative, unclassified [Panicum miliaceum]
MVAFDFVHRRLAPLQACRHLAWFYTGPADISRLTSGERFDHDEAVLVHLMVQTTNVRDVAMFILPVEVKPLCADPARHIILDTMPWTDARGLVVAAAQPKDEAPSHGGATLVASEGAVEPCGLVGREGLSSGGIDMLFRASRCMADVVGLGELAALVAVAPNDAVDQPPGCIHLRRW